MLQAPARTNVVSVTAPGSCDARHVERSRTRAPAGPGPGYEAQHRAFDLVTGAGGAPPVIDADDLCADPGAVVAAWCEAVAIEHRPDTLTWRAGMPDDWRLWADWFVRAAASTCFAPPDGRPPPPVDAPVTARIERCREHYDVLRGHRLRT